MNKMKRSFTMALIAILAATSLSISVAAAENDPNKKNGEAGIDFTQGDTTITPTPDPDLNEIKNTDIYFGRQKISGGTQEYNSVTTHADTPRQHAGFIVSAGNADGWSVFVQMTGFEMEEQRTMKGFFLQLKPGTPKTTQGNETGVAPLVYPARLEAAENGGMGESNRVFYAKEGDGFGKWGCNWEGDLTVPGGSVVEEGEASATMLWTLLPGDVEE